MWIDINELIRELLAVKAANEDLTKRVAILELEVERLARELRLGNMPSQSGWDVD